MKHHIKTKYCDELVSFRWGAYASGQRSLRLMSDAHGPIMVVTVHVVNYTLPFGHIIVKDYSENEGIREELIRVGVIKPRPVDVIQSGYVNLYVHELLPGVDEVESLLQESPIPSPTPVPKPACSAPSPGVDKVAKIIQKRDDLSYDEAREIVEDCVASLRAIAADESISPFLALEAMAEQIECDLGLEPDYIDELVFEQI